MAYTIDDIQIFLLTGNRTNFLKDSISSLFKSSAGINDLYVLNYSNTDKETPAYIEELKDKRIHYFNTYTTPENQRYSNYLKVRELAKKKFLMIMHDDDIVHPDYLKQALKILNQEQNLSLVSCRTHPFNDGEKCDYSEPLSNKYILLKDKVIFNSIVYSNHFDICYPASIMDKEIYLRINSIDLFNLYLKLSDGMLLQDMLTDNHSAAIMCDCLYFYRRHKEQDTNDKSVSLTVEQFKNFLKNLDNDDFNLWGPLLKVWHLERWYEAIGNNSDYSLKELVSEYTNPIFLYLHNYVKKAEYKFYPFYRVCKAIYGTMRKFENKRMRRILDGLTKEIIG